MIVHSVAFPVQKDKKAHKSNGNISMVQYYM